MNRDLPRRVKQGSKASYVRRAVVNDIKLAKELIEYYDKKAELWQNRQGQTETTEDGDEKEEEEEEEEEEGRQDNVRLATTYVDITLSFTLAKKVTVVIPTFRLVQMKVL